MNKMHALAKIMLAGLALYIAFYLCTTLIVMPFALLSDARYEASILSIVLFLFISLCLATSIYLLLSKRDKLAEKIVGTAERPDTEAKIQWLPVAFRLISVAAGLFCLYRLLTAIIWAVQRYSMAKATRYLPKVFTVEQVLGWVLLFAIGIYLLSGAPHFVRWQVKKTLAQCKQPPTKN